MGENANHLKLTTLYHINVLGKTDQNHHVKQGERQGSIMSMAKEPQQIPQYILTCLFPGALVTPSPFSQHLGCANHSTCYVLMVSASSHHAT